jgi:leader peptidase (prepilin peptidase) / N-methyltransferase
MIALAAFGFVLGIVAGSFATAAAHRVPREMSLWGPRSLCPACGAQIGARDNVPLVSWLLLRGRARCCGTKISLRYPLTELLSGLLFAAVALVFHDQPAEIAIGMVFVTMLAVITLTDLERRVIPNKVLLAGSLLCLAIAVPTDPAGTPERLIAAAAGGGIFFLAALAYPAGMGLGDVKLAAAMGLFLGRSVGPAILVALLSGSLVGGWMLVRHGAEARKMAIPFGPFLALGGIVGLLVGNQLIDAYLG